jgi:DNA-binding NtrC family response regulator
VKNPKNPIIYIIDNSRIYCEIVKNCLEALNYKNIYSFSRCEELEIQRLTADIVILDQEFGLNRMKGIDFIRECKTHNPQTHFIFFSSSTNIEVAVNSIKSGALDYIVKSKIGLDRLVKKINYLMNAEIKMLYTKKIYNAAVVSLSMVGLILIIAIFLYNNQII